MADQQRRIPKRWVDIQSPEDQNILRQCYDWISDRHGFNTFRMKPDAPRDHMERGRRLGATFQAWMRSGEVDQA
jgi:hypothetical protein